MARTNAAVTALRAYGRDLLEGDDVESLLIELEGQSDRSFAIIMGTMVEHALTFGIRSRLRQGEAHKELFQHNSPLGSFSNKITMGYALELFGQPARQELDYIREVRNAAAHSKRPISFDAPQVKAVCSLMRMAETLGAGANRDRSREWFFQCCRLLIDALGASGYRRLTEVQRDRLA